jgi:hypothetical protein
VQITALETKQFFLQRLKRKRSYSLKKVNLCKSDRGRRLSGFACAEMGSANKHDHVPEKSTPLTVHDRIETIVVGGGRERTK